MTKEEAIRFLKRDRCWQGVPPDTQMAIETLMQQPSLPSNLDEAAEELYPYKEWYDVELPYPSTFDENKYERNTFKAGARWRDAQIPKLPSDIDEAAEKAYKEYDVKSAIKPKEYPVGFLFLDGFKAGAKWMAGQGESITADVVEFNGGKMLSYDGEFAKLVQKRSFGDKVIVQIRKK